MAKDLYIHVFGVQFTKKTPANSQPIKCKNSVQAAVRKSGDPKMWIADAAPGPLALAVTNRRREVSIRGADLSEYKNIPQGEEGLLEWFVKNQDPTKPGLHCKLQNAQLISEGGDHKTQDFASGELMFAAVWTEEEDGSYTDPYAVVPIAEP